MDLEQMTKIEKFLVEFDNFFTSLKEKTSYQAEIGVPNGKGVAYSFDPVGSYEPLICCTGELTATLVQPFLDNQVKNFYAVFIITKYAFTSAVEGDIYTANCLEIFIMTK
ncbi:14327_t:CDS:2, partial [Entrophospora sp. SA101]